MSSECELVMVTQYMDGTRLSDVHSCLVLCVCGGGGGAWQFPQDKSPQPRYQPQALRPQEGTGTRLTHLALSFTGSANC